MLKSANHETCSDCIYLLEIRTTKIFNVNEKSEKSEYFCTAEPNLVQRPSDLINKCKCRFYQYLGNQGKSVTLLEKQERL